VNQDPKHGATTIRASKPGGGGGGGKWLLAALAAVVLAGGAYAAWTAYSPDQAPETAYNEPYGETPLTAEPIDADANLAADAASVADPPTPAAAPEPQAPRAQPADFVPSQVIGVTPASVSIEDADEIVVTGARRPIWVRTPSARRLSSMYPQRALERGREGEAALRCIVEENGALDCEEVSATPGGFGGAALRVANSFRHALQLPNGRDAVGTPVNLRVLFRIAD